MARTQPGSCPTPAPLPPRASAGHLPSPASPPLSPGSASSAAGSIPAGTRSAGTRSATAAVRPHSSRRCSGDPAGGHLRAAGTSPGRPRRADWACSGVGRPGAAGDKRMQSRGPAPAVQGRRAQAAALADALASLGRTPARMASLAAYGNDGRWPAPGGSGVPWLVGPGSCLITPENFGVGSGEIWKGGSRLQRASAPGSGSRCSVFAERVEVKTPEI